MPQSKVNAGRNLSQYFWWRHYSLDGAITKIYKNLKNSTKNDKNLLTKGSFLIT